MVKVFVLYGIAVLCIVSLEVSFFDLMFPWTAAPFVVLASVVAWTFISGFSRALFLVIPVTIGFDLVTFGRVGVLTLYAVALVYATGFLSRRLLVEHRGLGTALSALFACAGVGGYVVLTNILRYIGHAAPAPHMLPALFLSVFSADFLLTCLLGAVLFFPVYWILERFDRYVRFVADKEGVRMR